MTRYRDQRGRFAIDPGAWWDPRTWEEPGAVRVYLDRAAETYALLDPEDYKAFGGYMWSLSSDGRTKRYARCIRTINGWRTPIYLHRMVMLAAAKPPSPKHTYVDHLNGNGLDCRRRNLRWATPRENAMNLYGNWIKQGALFEPDLSML